MKRIVPLALASCTLLAGCGPATHLDLELRSVNVTAARLLTPALALVPPATTPVPASLPALPPLTPYLEPPGGAHQAPTVTAPPAACPKASLFAVPARPGTPLVDGHPAAASYVQRATGRSDGAGGQTSLDGLVRTSVVDLPSSTTSTGQQVDSWRVERRWGRSSSVEVYDLLHSSAADAAIEPGIYLVGLAWEDPVLGRVSFRPVGNGLEVLPNPVAIAQQPVHGVAAQYAGSGTDPQTLTTLSLVRNVMGPLRVDVCGQLVDTYTVAMTGTLVSRDAQWQVAWTQQLATAYGGIDVASTLALSSPSTGVSWTRSLRSTTVPVAPR